MQTYQNQDPFYGFTNVPWISVNRAFDRLDFFTQTPANLVAAEQSRITGSEFIKKTVSAAYAKTGARDQGGILSRIDKVDRPELSDPSPDQLRAPSDLHMIFSVSSCSPLSHLGS